MTDFLNTIELMFKIIKKSHKWVIFTSFRIDICNMKNNRSSKLK